MDRHEGELELTGGRETAPEGHGMEAAGDFWGEPINVYTRADALADGVLVDVTETAREAGFSVPAAITAAVEADLRDFDAGELPGQDYEGRLWDLIFSAT